MTARPTITGLGHVGLHASDLEALTEFYRAVLGLQIVGQGDLNAEGLRSSVFLSSRPEDAHYQVAIYANPNLGHIAFEVASLTDLQTFNQRVVERDLPIRWALNHGVSLAFYFADPAGNLIKLYWPTGVAYSHPHGHPIDLTQPEAVLRQDVADLVAQLKVSKGGEEMT